MAKDEPRQITKEEAWQISCHEAGHAVLGVRLQIPFLRVERGDGEYGEVPVGVGPIEAPEGNWGQDDISRWQLFYAAGAAAEQLLFDGYRDYASRRDRSLHEALESRRRQKRIKGWDEDIQSAMPILDEESVEKVAKELDRQRRLSELQVYRLLGCTPSWF
jgi:hypothetical protein